MNFLVIPVVYCITFFWHQVHKSIGGPLMSEGVEESSVDS